MIVTNHFQGLFQQNQSLRSCRGIQGTRCQLSYQHGKDSTATILRHDVGPFTSLFKIYLVSNRFVQDTISAQSRNPVMHQPQQLICMWCCRVCVVVVVGSMSLINSKDISDAIDSQVVAVEYCEVAEWCPTPVRPACTCGWKTSRGAQSIPVPQYCTPVL
jgi:hypothetical protein